MRRRSLVLCLVASLLVAGCGGGVDAALLATAVQKTQDAGGAELAFQLEMEIPGLAEPVVMTGSGVEDAKRRLGQVEFDMSALAELPGAAALCKGDCGMQVVTDGSAVYMQSALFASQLGGKQWMKIDLERVGSAMSLPMQNGMTSPSASEQLRMLGSISGGVSDEGSEVVRGEQATHYKAEVDLRKTADALPPAQRETARQGIDRLIELTGQSELPVDVWIDSQDRVRRVEVEQSMKQAGVEVSVRMVVEYVRFGVPVEIEVPPAHQVFDATALALQGLSQAP
jgi:hypothetical protein